MHRSSLPSLAAGLALLGCSADPAPAAAPVPAAAPDPASRSPAPPPAATASPPTARPAPDAGAPLRYDLRFPDATTHMVDVTLTLPADLGAAGPIELWMPAWTPGSYLIREYARHVEGVEARDAAGAPVALRRTAKDAWTAEGPVHTVRYRVYAREPSVRTNFVDGELAVLNGAPTFLLVTGAEGRRHRVVAHPAPGWAGAWTGLDPTPGAPGPTDWTAADIDELIDSPIVLGTATTHDFVAGDRPHELVLAGTTASWDIDRAAGDVAAIVAATQALWGTVPYDHYRFLNVANGTRGGLEHLDSTLMMSAHRVMGQRERYLSWLGLVSHEFFHTWNVKRLRPAALGPFDYRHEVRSPSLWVSEGLTSYYDDLLLVRAGLMTEDEYLGRISDQVGKLQTVPGRQVQTLAAASAEAWIKHYRKDENTVNTAISYYVKGMAVGWLLDARIRAATGDQASLDDALRTAYARFSGDRGFTPEDFEGVLRETVGPAEAEALQAFLDQAIRSTDELDYGPALAWWGLRWADPEAPPSARDDGSPGDPPADPPAGWLGATLDSAHGRTVIQRIKRGTPAHAAGLQVGDELVAVAGWRVPPKGPEALWAEHRPGETVELTVARRGTLRTVSATLGTEPADRFVLERDPDAPPEAAARRAAWLGLATGD